MKSGSSSCCWRRPVGERNSESCCERGARLRRRRTSVPDAASLTRRHGDRDCGAAGSGWSSRRRWIPTDPPYGGRLPRRSRSPHGSDPPANACLRPAGPSANRTRPAAAGDHARRPPPPSRRAHPPARPRRRSRGHGADPSSAGRARAGDLGVVANRGVMVRAAQRSARVEEAVVERGPSARAVRGDRPQEGEATP